MRTLLLSVLFLLPSLPIAGDTTQPGLPPPAPKPEPRPVAPEVPKPRAPEPEPEPAPAEKAVAWQDPVTGHHYMFVPGKRHFVKAFHACRNRGWDLFNFRYLSTAELTRFMESSAFKAMPWKTRFEGDPGEIREAKFWSSSEKTLTISSSAEVVELRVRKIDPRLELTTGWYDAGGNDELSPQFATFCMYRGRHWYRCSMQMKCRHYAIAAGSHAHLVPFITAYETLTESGESEAEAYQRLRARGTVRRRSGDEPGNRYDCEPIPTSLSCTRDR